MSRSSRKKGLGNIAAGTAMHVNTAVMIAAVSVLSEPPAPAGNPQKSSWNKRSQYESHQLLF